MEDSEKDYAKASVEDVLKHFKTDPEKGLSADEAAKRITKYGKNEIPEKEETVFHRIIRRFWGPIPWMIETAAVLSAAVKKWEDFIIIMVLLVSNVFIDFWQESKALSTLKVLKDKIAKKTLVLRGGIFKEMDARELVPGDIVKVRIGSIIPADIKIIDGEYLQVDQSALTGESLPVTKKTGDLAYSNSIAKKGEVTGIVTGTGLNTFFGKTVKLIVRAEKENKSHFQKAVVHIGNYLILLTIMLVSVIILTALFRHENMLEIIRFSLVLTVAAIPVALPAVLTVTMAVGAMRLAKQKAIVSRLAAIEELAGVDILCSDKTGTLTQNVMTVSRPVLFGTYTPDDLMYYGGLASKEENKDPIETPVFDYAKEHGIYERIKASKQIKFSPFDPVSKRTEALVQTEEGTMTVTKGAPQVVLKLCKNINEDEVNRPVLDFAEKGFRTLGVAVKRQNDKTFQYVGLIPLFDPPREDSKETIAETEELHLKVKMLTGDNTAIAKHIAEVLGLGVNILDAKELKGGDYREYIILADLISKTMYKNLDPGVSEEKVTEFSKKITKEVEEQLENIPLPKGYVKKHESQITELIEGSDGFAQVFPEDKFMIVNHLQRADHIVAMTGDGVNDAPALRKADAGIAVSSATDAAKAAASLVLLAPGLAVIVNAIKIARVTFERMKSYAMYRITETLRIIFFMTASILLFNFYPVTALMIILLAFLNDLPILAIAYDNTRIDAEPVRWNMKEIMTVSTVLGISGVIASFGIFYIAKEYFHLSTGAIQTFVFLKLAIAGHLTIFLTRTESHFWKKPYPSAALFWAAVITKVLATLFAVYGWFIAPIGWKLGIINWVYSFVWMFFNDFLKIWVYKWLRKEKIIK